MGHKRVVEIAASGGLAEARRFIAAAKEAGYDAVFLRKFDFTEQEIEALKKEFSNPLEITVVPEFHSHESLYFSENVIAGQTLTNDLIQVSAPLRGLTKELLPKILNKKILYDMKKGEPITFGVVDL